MSYRIHAADGEPVSRVYTTEDHALVALKRRREDGASVVWYRHGVSKVWLWRLNGDVVERVISG